MIAPVLVLLALVPLAFAAVRRFGRRPKSAGFRIRLVDDRARAPARTSAGAAGYDLALVDGAALAPRETRVVGLGFQAAVPRGTYGQIKPRSSLVRRGLTVDAGVMDADYRGEWKLALHNRTAAPVALEAGERVAQVLLLPVRAPEVVVVEALDDTARGGGGFGSTGRLARLGVTSAAARSAGAPT